MIVMVQEKLNMNRKEFIKKYSQKIYIGDSVYAYFDGYHFILETHNGFSDDPRNRIALEPPVFENLIAYRKNVYQEAENITNEGRVASNLKMNYHQ